MGADALQTQVLIIGAGVTGTGLARDLALRGIGSIVVEKQDVNAGASGGNHGLLHSGARYVASDQQSARECHQENLLLKQLAPHCVETTGGLFVAVAGDDEKYIADFPAACQRCGIQTLALDVREARDLEPALTNKVIAAFEVDDATIDPFKLSLENIAQAQALGSRLLLYHRVVGFRTSHGRIRQTAVQDEATGRMRYIKAEVVVNAAGAWAGVVAQLAGAHLPMHYSKGSLLVTQDRMARRVINRLRWPADGDILVPGGWVSILGTTSERVASPDMIFAETHEADAIIDQVSEMVPGLKQARFIRAYCGVRPLMGGGEETDDRTISRGFQLIDHAQQPEKITNLVTITGGKLTTYRLMAEKTADLVGQRLGVQAPGSTHLEPLPDAVAARWTDPGLPPDRWIGERSSTHTLLCECELVPQNVAESIVNGLEKYSGLSLLRAIGLRSRVGKGPCQGTFCSQRLTAFLYEKNYLQGDEGIAELYAFLQERWRGQRPLLWGMPLIQMELMEAMYCGLFGLESAELKNHHFFNIRYDGEK
jgi:glycerol-3-phosphate dehydrogenase